MIHININQPNNITEQNVPAQLISKLYTLCKNVDNNLEQFSNNTNLIGSIKTTYTYNTYIEYLNSKFNELSITYDGLYVLFEDKNLETYIKQNLFDILYPNNEYEGIINTFASTNDGNSSNWGLRHIFALKIDNTSIDNPSSVYGVINFDELNQFARITSIAADEFNSNTTLTSIDLTNIEKIGSRAFKGTSNLIYFNGNNSELGTLRLPNLKTAENYIFQCVKNSNNIYEGPQLIYIYNLGTINNIPYGFCCYNKYLEYIDPNVFTNILKINNDAFRECSNLYISDLKLPMCNSIGNYSFQNVHVNKISEIAGSSQIGNYAFENCLYLSEITQSVLDNISSIGEASFQNCNLTIDDLKLPNLTSINNYAFQNNNIKKISNLGNITKCSGFKNNSLLTDVTLPASVTELGSSAFENCTALTTGHINLNNVTVLGYNCLRNSGLTGIFNGANITNIAGGCCTGIFTSLYFPYITNTAQNLTYNRANDVGFDLTDSSVINNPYGYPQRYRLDGSNSFRNNASYTSTLLCGINNSPIILYLKNIESIFGLSMGGSSKAMGVSGFNQKILMDIKYLVINNINIPEVLESILRYDGYYTCTNFILWNESTNNYSVRNLAVPRRALASYKTYTATHHIFDNSSNTVIETNTIYPYYKPDGTHYVNIIPIESMGHFTTKAEYDAAPDYPDGVHHKDEYLISEYMGLQSGETINWDADPTWSYYLIFADQNVLSTLLGAGIGDGIGITAADASSAIFNKTLFEGNTNIQYFNEFSKFRAMGSKTVNVSQGGVTWNESYKFQNCTNLKSIDLSNQTAPIPLNAFDGCTSLISINRLSSSCTRIDSNAFRNCTSLTSIDLSNITEIRDSAFYGCTSLTNVVWPTQPFQLSGDVFRNNENLTGTIDITLSNVQSANSWGNSCSNTFRGTNIEKLIVRAPNIQTFHQQGSGVYEMTSSIGSSIKVINIRHTGVIAHSLTFSSNSNLIVAITPETSGGYGFSWDFIGNCPNIKYLIIMADSLIDTNSDGFDYMFRGNNGPNANIYVKDNLLNTYLNHSKLDSNNNQVGWSKYASRIKPISELPTDEYIDGLSIAELVDE